MLIYTDDTPEGWQSVKNLTLERQFCLWAIPAMLFVAMMFNITSLGHFLQRTFLTMPVHELGHAVTAWFCGFAAIPMPWRTLAPEARGVTAPLILAGLLGLQLFRGWQADRKPVVYVCSVLLFMQALGTFILKHDTAQQWIIFGGDGIGMVFAVLLIGSFYAGKDTQIYKGALRWGFLVIGAATFVDIFGTWWRAYRNEAQIPFGTSGGEASDMMKLVETWQWTLQEVVMRYLTLGFACMLVIALIYAWGLWRVNQEVDARQRVAKREERERRRKAPRDSPAA